MSQLLYPILLRTADIVAVASGLEAVLLHPLRSDSGYLATHPSAAEAGRSSEERGRGRPDTHEGYHPELR